jgi:Xaa-Pro aminopeptidase
MTQLENPETIEMEMAYQSRAKAASHRQGKCVDFTFNSQEKKGVVENIRKHIIAKYHIAGMVIFSPANFAYVSAGMILPDAMQQTQPLAAVICLPDYRQVIFCQAAHVELLREQGWQGEIHSYGLNTHHMETGLIEEIGKFLKKEVDSSVQLGYDSALLPAAFVDALHQQVELKWLDVSQQLEKLRMVKSTKEIFLIGEAVRQADRGLISALNHSEGNLLDSWGYSMWEFAERIRVHIGEMGGHGAGQITAVQGANAAGFAAYPDGNLVQGNFLRTEISNHYRGYWSVGGRTLHVGWATPVHKADYQKNTSLKNAALDLLKPGMRCCDIYTKICDLSKQETITLRSEFGLGHGLGLTEFEAPYLNQYDETVLEEGMVLVLSIVTESTDQQLLASKEVVVITRDGNKVLSWYRNWDEIYEMTGNTARHG